MKRLILIIGFFSTFISASEIEFNGFIDTYHAICLNKQNEFNASRTRLRGELFSQIEDASFFTSFNAVHNNILNDETKIELREAFMEYISSKWDIRIGRQIITWGNADGMQITDIICPGDFTEFITRDFDDIRMPIESVKLRYLSGFSNIEIIWIPFFQASCLPTGNNPWTLPTNNLESINIVTNNSIEPNRKLENGEIAGKISFYLSGIDLAFSGFYTWDDMPTIHTKTVNDTIYINPKYHRLNFFGMEINKPINDFVIRSEIAYYQNKHFQSHLADDKTEKRNMLKGMIGLDWYPGNDWNFSAQFADDIILNYQTKLEIDENNLVATLNISKKLFRQTIELSNMIYYNFNETDIYNKISIDYALNDELHFSVGSDIFSGNKGVFGKYSDNTQIWIKGKYSF